MNETIKNGRKKRCISKLYNYNNKIVRCSNTQECNKLCDEHYRECYFKNEENEVIETETETETEIKTNDNNTQKKNEIYRNNVCPICLTDAEDEINLSICCNYTFHYRCLEEYLCYHTNILICPICKYEYTSESIIKHFTKNQITVLNDKIDEDILEKKKKMTANLKKFKYESNRIKILMDNIQQKRAKLMTLYKNSCKEKNKIDKQFNKESLLEDNYIKVNNTNLVLNAKITLMKNDLDYFDYIFDNLEDL